MLVIETDVLSLRFFGLKRIESSSIDVLTELWIFIVSSPFAPEIVKIFSANVAFAPSVRGIFLFTFLAISKTLCK